MTEFISIHKYVSALVLLVFATLGFLFWIAFGSTPRIAPIPRITNTNIWAGTVKYQPRVIYYVPKKKQTPTPRARPFDAPPRKQYDARWQMDIG